MNVVLKNEPIMNQQFRVGTLSVKYTDLFTSLEVLDRQTLEAVFLLVVVSCYLGTGIRTKKKKSICYE